ncbi:Uma2 family endonuclease [Persephonella atlantica]|uniref:Uma2 family endonuclease n=1 Tax=Persephonella atlantica TaxID=2699429 RepID=A0ABS1GGX1_9AQUI|nr:Uma2 family endonuclease [Persephonella atlantica]MBK3332167.1 Uma2 family endonuclease [Persephonella atlantica]
MSVLEKRKLTYKDINRLPEGSYEIIDGDIVEMAPTGFEHGEIELDIGYFLRKKLKDKGYVSSGEVGILISRDPLRIRGADIVYISKERLKEKPKGILEIPPDLIIEIISPNNTVSEMEEKIEDYFKIGVPRVILIDPQTQKVYLYQNGKKSINLYTFDEELEFIDGLKAKVKDIIE